MSTFLIATRAFSPRCSTTIEQVTSATTALSVDVNDNVQTVPSTNAGVRNVRVFTFEVACVYVRESVHENVYEIVYEMCMKMYLCVYSCLSLCVCKCVCATR